MHDSALSGVYLGDAVGRAPVAATDDAETDATDCTAVGTAADVVAIDDFESVTLTTDVDAATADPLLFDCCWD